MATIECCGFITVLCDNPDCQRGHVVPDAGTGCVLPATPEVMEMAEEADDAGCYQ